MLLWEAFVSGSQKRDSHVADAEAGARAFLHALPSPDDHNAIACPTPVHSLIGAALLRSEWSSDLAIMAEPCLVLKPRAEEAEPSKHSRRTEL